MVRYIDADKLVDTICEEYGVDPYYYQDLNDNLKAYTDSLILERVGTIPTADVAPVVHAHKVRAHSQGGGTHWVICSNCEKPIDWEDSYCKHCGAKMDEETRNET